jgi:hypothetical protein
VHVGAVVRIGVDWSMAGGGSPVAATFQLRIGGTVVTSVTTPNATVTHGRSRFDIYINHMTNASNTLSSVSSAMDGASTLEIDGEFGTDTIDWTTDQEVTFFFSAQGTTNDFILSRISIEILGAN